MEQIWMNQFHNSSQTQTSSGPLSSTAFPKLSSAQKSNTAPRVSKSQRNVRAGVDANSSSSQIFDPVKWPSLAELEINQQHNDSKNRSTDSEGSENTSTNAATTNIKSAKQNAKNSKNHNKGKNSSVFNNLETVLNLNPASDRDDFGLRGLAASIRRMCVDDKERNVSGSLGSTAASSVSSSISAENLGLGEALAFTSGISNNDRSPRHHSNNKSTNQISSSSSSSRRPLLGRIYNSALDEQQASLWSSVHTEADYPEEYANVFRLQEQKLPGPYCHPNWKTDLLFFFFYTAPGDGLQLAGASLLYERGWRYNMSNGMWIARIPNVPPEYRTATLEKGDFQVFDPVSWSRKQVNMVLRYDDLATQTKVDPQHSRIYSILQQSASATRSNNNNNQAQSGSSQHHGHGGNGGASQQAAATSSSNNNSNQQQNGSQQQLQQQQHRHQQRRAVATAAAAQAAQQQQEQQRARQQQLYMNQQLQQFTRGAGGSGNAGNGNNNNAAAPAGNGNNNNNNTNAASATQTIENYLRLMQQHANNNGNANGSNYLL